MVFSVRTPVALVPSGTLALPGLVQAIVPVVASSMTVAPRPAASTAAPKPSAGLPASGVRGGRTWPPQIDSWPNEFRWLYVLRTTENGPTETCWRGDCAQIRL